ncbi:MAG TPA: zf-HC2 domain-containing protein [Bryobacteraceae bacterium]|nr:zf-HC2 domain-containing protein [Bryobacteraceae bacterium]
MSRMQFGEGGCEKARKYFDAYISNELLVETNQLVLSHVEGCPACATELDARTRLRNRLKSAVLAQSVPPELQVRVRQRIRESESRTGALGWLSAGWPRWAAATAAALLVGAGLWVNFAPERLPALSDRPAQNAYITKVSANLAAVLKVGLGDHIHCSIFRKYPKEAPQLEKMESDLGPQYAGLLPVVQAAVPKDYRVIMAHQCGFAGRRFVHLTFEKDGRLLSLVVAHKQASDSIEGLLPVSDASGIPIYQSAAGRYEVAGFEAGNFLAYIVSDQRNMNLQIAENVAPGVREFLMKIAA